MKPYGKINGNIHIENYAYQISKYLNSRVFKVFYEIKDFAQLVYFQQQQQNMMLILFCMGAFFKLS